MSWETCLQLNFQAGILFSTVRGNQINALCGPSEESHPPYMPTTGKHLHETETIECGRFILSLNRLY